MLSKLNNVAAFAVITWSGGLLSACGGGSSQIEASGSAQTLPPSAATPQTQTASPATPALAPPVPSVTTATPVVVIANKPPQPKLSLTDTGLNVTDGVTQNGLFAVTNDGFSWEYSLNSGASWTRGVGGSFELKGDGPKTIWARSFDAVGNLSDVAVANCVLDTIAPQAVSIAAQTDGVTRAFTFAGLETGAQWEHSLNAQSTWWAGSGSKLGVLGNGVSRIWIRQLDIAGNASSPQLIELEQPNTPAWHEASGEPLKPSVLAAAGLTTMVIHGVVARGDADYVRWDIPVGYRLKSVKLVHYVSDDKVAFYTIQRAPVFDAGFDVNRMLVYGHLGPDDLARNVVASLPNGQLETGSMTLWFQQTGPIPTEYALEVMLASIN
jgi:hypothetical protein